MMIAHDISIQSTMKGRRCFLYQWAWYTSSESHH